MSYPSCQLVIPDERSLASCIRGCVRLSRVWRNPSSGACARPSTPETNDGVPATNDSELSHRNRAPSCTAATNDAVIRRAVRVNAPAEALETAQKFAQRAACSPSNARFERDAVPAQPKLNDLKSPCASRVSEGQLLRRTIRYQMSRWCLEVCTYNPSTWSSC